MKLTLSNKLIGGFIGVSLLVLIAGVVGITMVGKVVDSAETVIKDKMPLIDASMEALISVEKVISESRNYQISRSGLEKIKGAIGDASKRFDEHISTIEERTEGEIKALAGKADSEFEVFKKASGQLINAHDKKIGYVFTHKGAEYDIKSFLYYIGIQLSNWSAALADAAKYDVEFTRGTDASKSDFGIWYKSFKTDDKKLAKRLKKFNKLNNAAHEWAEKINGVSGDVKMSYYERMKARQLNKAAKELNKMQKYMAPLFDKLVEEERQALHEMEGSSEEIIKILEGLESAIDREVEMAEESAVETQSAANMILISTVVIAVIVSVLLGIILSSSITKPVAMLAEASKKMAEGDLTQKVKVTTSDEIGAMAHSFNEMSEKMREMMKEIRDSSSNLATASEQISSSTEELAAGADNQSRQSSDIASAIEEMATSVQGTFTNAQKSLEISKSTSETAAEGNNIVRKTMTGMNRIEQSVSDTAAKVENLGARSKEIGKIVGVIKDIAAQTNLLALNAAIEANRAGEHGRGFEVVAEEIRKLAEKSAESTLQITDIVGEIQSETDGAVDAMKSVTKEVESGTNLSNETGEALQKIISQVNETVSSIELVAEASKQQASVSDEVAASMESISTIVKESASSSEEIAQTAQELARLGDNLQKMTGKFNI